MRDELESIYERLSAWCRARGYAGADPFDALNSPLFQATPLKRSRFARLIWTQAFKRSPVNLRPLLLVPTGRNPKGTALFALAALSRFRATGGAEHERAASALLDDLLGARIGDGGVTGGAAWGYNFDWQGRAFYAPKGTPAVVPTAFAIRALTEAAEACGKRQGASGETQRQRGPVEYLAAARAACDLVLCGLNRSHETEEEICFSYTPFDRTRVFNASLLAGEALAAVGALTGEQELLDLAARAARYVVRRQRGDGSWAYGAEGFQSWADNFHTAFILTSLARLGHRLAATDGRSAAELNVEVGRALKTGFEFWRENFFLASGWPKYFPDRKYPADAHSAGAAVVACAELAGAAPGAVALAERVARWAVDELYDRRGFFRYQRRRFYTVRTPYMRWSQGWMLYALARLLEVKAGR